MAQSVGDYPIAQKLRPISWVVVMVGLVGWSLLAWVGYILVDPVLGWVASNGGVLLDSGKGLAVAAGGKEVGNAVSGLDVSGLFGQLIALLQVILKPAIVVVWVLGALALFTVPWLLPRVGRLLSTRRH